MSYSENSMLYRYFSEVDPEISNGTFSLSFPRKRRWKNCSLTALWMELTLVILFPTMTYGGIRTIGGRESESGYYDSSMWLARGYKDIFTDGTINFDKALHQLFIK